MSAAREVEDPQVRGEKFRPEGRVRARPGVPMLARRRCDGSQRGTRSARRCANPGWPTRNRAWSVPGTRGAR